MAGEWIPIDIGLDEKPEVQELIDLTGEPVEVVTYRLRKLWGWASMNSEDGTVRTTPVRLARTCGGGDERFWLAVETVGWLQFAEDGTALIPGWGRRFSQAAKARAMHLDRAGRARQACADGAPKRSKSAREECAQAQQKRTREEDRTDSSSSSPVVDVAQDGETLRAAWNAAARAYPSRIKPYGSDGLPEATLERLAVPGWLQEALRAIERLPGCRYFSSPVTLGQFSGVKAGRRFTARVLEQEFDNPREPVPAARFGGQDERRSAADAAAEWERKASDPEAARRRTEFLEAKARKAKAKLVAEPAEDLETTKRAVVAKLREAAS